LPGYPLFYCNEDIHSIRTLQENQLPHLLAQASTLLIAFQSTLSSCSTQTLYNHKNDLLAVAELFRQIRTCSLRLNLLVGMSFWLQIASRWQWTIVTHKHSAQARNLFASVAYFMWWFMSCIILRFKGVRKGGGWG